MIRSRWLLLTGMCAAVVAGAACGVPEAGDSEPVIGRAEQVVVPATPGGLVIGTYKFGTCDGCEPHHGPAGVDAYRAWLGSDRVLIGQDNAGDSHWEVFEQGYPGAFAQWQEWKAQLPGRRLALAVPMFVEQEQGTGGERISECAAGGYDGHYRALATNLVRHDLGDSTVRIGWEANEDWPAWSYVNNPQDWRTCWRRVAQTMNAVGPDLVMNWNVSDDKGGRRSYLRDAVELRGFDSFYPGDDVVEEIGIDTYNAPQTIDYDAYFGTDVGELGWFVRIAAERGKQLSVPEWGLWDSRGTDRWDGSRDDPVYIERMHAWLSDPQNRIAWASYFDVNLDDQTMHQLQPDWEDGTVFPEASRRFQELFGEG